MVISEKPEKKKGGRGWKAAAAAAVLAVLAGGLSAWYLTRDRFHDVTVELGTDFISISQFMTRYARGSRVAFVTDPQDIDISSVGVTEVTLRDGSRQETVTLTVQDTVAPVFTLKPEVESGLSVLPDASAFVTYCEDEDRVTFSYEGLPLENADYGDVPVTIVATDASGNRSTASSVLSLGWIRKAFTAEYGTEITREDLLLDPEATPGLITDRTLRDLNRADIGTYEITCELDGRAATCAVTKQDTTPPDLMLQDVSVLLNRSARMRDFVVSADDARGGVELTMETELTFDTLGSQEVTITATDGAGNSITRTATLYVKEDVTPPAFSGLSSMTVAKHSSPDFSEGVSAYDRKDGEVTFTVDASRVDLDHAGTYFVTYTAADGDDNVTTAKRKVEVEHDAVDTNKLLDELYDEMPDHSPEAMCEYIKVNFPYIPTYRGDDPLWYGLINRKGDCKVVADLLAAMLNRAGYPNIYIHSLSRHHYWNMVYLDGQWWHIDATIFFPSHLMNDKERKTRLRPDADWDRNIYPVSP